MSASKTITDETEYKSFFELSFSTKRSEIPSGRMDSKNITSGSLPPATEKEISFINSGSCGIFSKTSKKLNIEKIETKTAENKSVCAIWFFWDEKAFLLKK